MYIFSSSLDDEVAAALVFVAICTPPVLDAGGCTDILSATIHYNATPNL